MRTTRAIIKLFVAQKGSEILGICIIHIIWSVTLGFYEPFPFRGILTGCVSLFAAIVQLWFLIPKSTRKDQRLRSKCKAFIYHHIWVVFVTFQLITIVTAILPKIPRDFQWFIAFVFPLTKEINDRMIGFFMTKSASSPNHNCQNTK